MQIENVGISDFRDILSKLQPEEATGAKYLNNWVTLEEILKTAMVDCDTTEIVDEQ